MSNETGTHTIDGVGEQREIPNTHSLIESDNQCKCDCHCDHDSVIQQRYDTMVCVCGCCLECCE